MIPNKLFERNNPIFNILLDSESLSSELRKDNQIIKRILAFSMSKHFEMIRTPLEIDDEDFKRIVQYKLNLEKDKRNLRIDYNENNWSVHAFWYLERDIEQIACHIYNKKEVSKEEIETTRLVFIQATLNRDKSQNSIFITENKILLKNRIWFETHFPGQKVNIVCLNEALEIMDLFLKFNQNHSVGPNFTYNEGLWYWVAFRNKIPHYNVSSKLINSLSNRFIYLLMSLDKMGFEYYLGVNNDTQANLIYFFNYYVSLVTGIMDNLALEAKDKFKVAFKNDHIPNKISLYNAGAGKDFLKALEQKNKPLRNHIRDYLELINLIYELREVVIHRDMLDKTAFEYNDEDGTKWESNFIKIDKNIWDIINRLTDSDELDPFSKWGKYKLHELYFLEPFTFCKEFLRRLIPFVDSFLEKLGFPDFIENLKSKNPPDRFLEDMRRLAECSLIYY